MAVAVGDFEDDHVAGAAEVLRRAHERHLRRQPLLARDPDVEGLIRREREQASGVVALDGERVVGYLLGRHASGPIGPHVWSTSAGHAADDPDLVFELYRAAAATWVDLGMSRHFVFAPAVRERVEPWFRLGFGASAFQAARPVDEPDPFRARDVTVRLSTPADLPDVAALAREQARHLRSSPSFSELAVESLEATMEEWRDTWGKPEYAHLVAERAGQVVGQLLLFERPPGDLRVPRASIDLASATTAEAVRGLGIGRTLTSAAIEWAREHDAKVMTADWRATNLDAARFWPRRGFRATYLRLYRSIP